MSEQPIPANGDMRAAIIEHTLALRYVQDGLTRVEGGQADLLRSQEALRAEIGSLKVDLATRDRLCGVHQTRIDEIQRQVRANEDGINKANDDMDSIGNAQRLLALGTVIVGIVAAFLGLNGGKP